MSVIMDPEYQVVYSQNRTITFKVTNDGVLRIISVGILLDPQLPSSTPCQVAMDIIASTRSAIRQVEPCAYLSDVIAYIKLYQKAARCIETAVLSPHTMIGKHRLQREFFELVI